MFLPFDLERSRSQDQVKIFGVKILFYQKFIWTIFRGTIFFGTFSWTFFFTFFLDKICTFFFNNIFWGNKIFWDKFFLGQNFLGTKCFGVKMFFVKIFLGQNLFGSKFHFRVLQGRGYLIHCLLLSLHLPIGVTSMETHLNTNIQTNIYHFTCVSPGQGQH